MGGFDEPLKPESSRGVAAYLHDLRRTAEPPSSSQFPRL